MKKIGMIALINIAILGSMQAADAAKGYAKKCYSVEFMRRARIRLAPFTYSLTEERVSDGKKQSHRCFVTLDEEARKKVVETLQAIMKKGNLDPAKTYVTNGHIPRGKDAEWHTDRVLDDFMKVNPRYTIKQVIDILQANNGQTLSKS